MPTVHVVPGADLLLQEIADALWKSKKVVVVTGAGISTNSGIPVSCFVSTCHLVFCAWCVFLRCLELTIFLGFQIGKRPLHSDTSSVRCRFS